MASVTKHDDEIEANVATESHFFCVAARQLLIDVRWARRI